jgi:hypothetical protein
MSIARRDGQRPRRGPQHRAGDVELADAVRQIKQAVAAPAQVGDQHLNRFSLGQIRIRSCP